MHTRTNIFDLRLAQFDEKARVVDRSNNYYWYQKCPICMQSKEMDIVKETGSAMTMKCSLCQGAYGCAVLWTYSFNTIPCAECNEKRPKGFTCSNCKQTYCQDCKFHLRAGNAYGWNNVCCRCVRDCGHGCDWAYVSIIYINLHSILMKCRSLVMPKSVLAAIRSSALDVPSGAVIACKVAAKRTMKMIARKVMTMMTIWTRMKRKMKMMKKWRSKVMINFHR
jgi:hypothetical protein